VTGYDSANWRGFGSSVLDQALSGLKVRSIYDVLNSGARPPHEVLSTLRSLSRLPEAKLSSRMLLVRLLARQ
jgi:hypothetical protein